MKENFYAIKDSNNIKKFSNLSEVSRFLNSIPVSEYTQIDIYSSKIGLLNKEIIKSTN